MINIAQNFTIDSPATCGTAGIAFAFMLMHTNSTVQQMRTGQNNTVTWSCKTNLAHECTLGFFQFLFQLSSLFSTFRLRFLSGFHRVIRLFTQFLSMYLPLFLIISSNFERKILNFGKQINAFSI